MECPVRFSTMLVWADSLRRDFGDARCDVETALLAAAAVGIPAGKRRVFVVAVRRKRHADGLSKLTR
ncbi:unnamed protein product [Pylaiella littoralis]